MPHIFKCRAQENWLKMSCRTLLLARIHTLLSWWNITGDPWSYQMMFPFLEVCHVFFVGFDLSQGQLYIYFFSVGFKDVILFATFSPVKNGLVGSDHLIFHFLCPCQPIYQLVHLVDLLSRWALIFMKMVSSP